jgi:hypothetical protein
MNRPVAPILVAYTWSPGGRAALAWALAEGAYRRRPVRVAHVVDPGPSAAGLSDRAEARRRLAGVVAQATNYGRVNVSTSVEVLAGGLADQLVRAAARADVLVLGPGAALHYEDPGWAPVWDEVECPVAIVRGPARIPDRRPVVVAVAGGGRDSGRPRANDEAAREAALRDVGLFAARANPASDRRPSVAIDPCPGQLVVTELPRSGTAAAPDELRWVLDYAAQCPLLLVPDPRTPELATR